jgi:hypothetical protein
VVLLGFAAILSRSLDDSGAPAPPDRGQAPAYFVDKDSTGGRCDDARPAIDAASPATPWCSLARAAVEAPPGAVVKVRGGSYSPLRLDGLTRSGYVSFRPASGEAVSLGGVSLDGSSFVRISGFRIAGISQIKEAEHVQLVANDITPEGVMIRGSKDVLVAGNHIHHLYVDPAEPVPPNPGNGYGVWMTEYGELRNRQVTIRDNHFEVIPSDAIQTGSTDELLIEGNEIERVGEGKTEGSHSDVLQVVEGRGIVVRGNYMHDSLHGVIVKALELRDIRFESNVIARMSAGFGLNLYDVDGLTLAGNTVWDTAAGVRLRDSGENPAAMRVVSMRNNIFDLLSNECESTGCADEQSHNLIAEGERTAGDLTGDPGFVDIAAGDFELAAGSPAVDAGTSLRAPAHDRLGRARTDDEETDDTGAGDPPWYDIGALERGGEGGRERPRVPALLPAPAGGGEEASAPPQDLELRVSANPYQSNSEALAGARPGPNGYVFVPDVPGVTRVAFYLDGRPYQVEGEAPWDLGGSTSGRDPDTSGLAGGSHTVVARVTTSRGTRTLKATFVVR